MKILNAALAAIMLSGVFSGAAFAHGFKGGDLEISHPYIPTPPTAVAKTAGGYLRITNTGTGPDRLIGIESAVAEKTELHTTEMDADGVAAMKHVPELEIPAGATVAFERGGYHIMFMGLKQALKEGDLVPGTLIFERAGRIDVEFSIDSPKEGEDHTGH
ncbi:copper chaperone PCu(A)C [Pseudogemmobacter bohemicus]|uniref:copper chaperone PCu(A)C n=1 Tax=Pseudogemmobacter bohemicus TaxID=2250708 RepID=UPI000DD42869|nr:copper chaperone PCu(A)C [Pseudogemmobacter bohemicus]